MQDLDITLSADKSKLFADGDTSLPQPSPRAFHRFMWPSTYIGICGVFINAVCPYVFTNVTAFMTLHYISFAMILGGSIPEFRQQQPTSFFDRPVGLLLLAYVSCAVVRTLAID